MVAASLPDTAARLHDNFIEAGLEFATSEEAPAPDSPPGGSVVIAELNRGFVLPWARLALVAESDLTGRRSGAARRRIQAKRRQISGPLDLAEGDLVVHEVHGIARYMGMVDRDLLGVHREYLVIEYAKGDRLYVPSDQIDLISKYIGGEAPKINRLGSSDWGKTKSRVRRKAREIAQELVVLYAKRQAAKGHSLRTRHAMAARARGFVPLRGDPGPAEGHRRGQGRHGDRDADGPVWCAVTSATARRRLRCALRSRLSRQENRSLF